MSTETRQNDASQAEAKDAMKYLTSNSMVNPLPQKSVRILTTTALQNLHEKNMRLH